MCADSPRGSFDSPLWPMVRENVPATLGPVTNLRYLGHLLHVEPALLKELAVGASAYYRPFSKQDKSGKVRRSDNPTGALKIVQGRIRRQLLNQAPVDDVVQGGVRGRSAETNAAIHAGSGLVVKVDIRDFFPTVSSRMVKRAFVRLGVGRKIASLLARLTTIEDRLPQGASTSTDLANLCMSSVDCEVKRLVGQGVRYTRFLDDLVLSGDFDGVEMMAVLCRCLRKYGFSPHRKRRKSRVMPASSNQSVTGFTVNRKVSLSVEERRNIRAAVRRLEASQSVLQKNLMSCWGRVRRLRRYHPKEGDALIARMTRIKANDETVP